MQLFVWRGQTRNFGDELNTLLWPRLLPGCFGATGRGLFLGIGSVLDARHAHAGRKVVAGAGYGGYEPPASLDGSWEIHWVRGPRTARQLGLPTAFGLGDPASLVPLVYTDCAYAPDGPIGFMPHFESLARGAWDEVAAASRVTLIDPRGEPGGVLSAIASCRLLLTEALHGAIVADALRVPWIALLPMAAIHRAKWLDWADTVDLKIRFRPLPPSTPLETVATRFGPRRCISVLGRHLGDGPRCRDRAAAALLSAASMPPQLSPDSALHRAQARMFDRLRWLRRRA